MTDSVEIKNYFDELAPAWNNNYKRSVLFTERMEKVKSGVDGLSLLGKKVLDIGCGSGMITVYFCMQGAEVYGIDISDNMISQADSLLKSRNLQAKLSLGDATHLEFNENHFDLLTCISVIEWIKNDQEALKEIARVLKEDGIALVSVPNQSSVLRKLEKLIFYIKRTLAFILPIKTGYLKHQKHQYRPEQFDRQCMEAGLEKIQEQFYGVPMSDFNFLKKMSRKSWFGMIYFVKLKKRGVSLASSHTKL